MSLYLSARPWLASLVVVFAASTSFAQLDYTSGHADLGVGYEDGEWDLHVHAEGATIGGVFYDDEEFEADEIRIIVPASVYVTGAPIDDPSLSDFRNIPESLGLVQGDSFWNLYQDFGDTVLTSSPYLGIGAEEVPLGVFVGNRIQIALTDFSGPGQMTVWTTSRIVFDTFDGLGPDDVLTTGVGPGAHSHFHYAFSAPGTYEVTLTASGTLVDGGAFTSGSGTYTFVVVPEASTLVMTGGLLLVGGIGRWAARRRRNG